MKTNFLKGIITLISFTLVLECFSQSTTDDNLPGGGKFLGYNGAQNLEFRTNNTTRMQMMQNGNSTINGYNINRSGFLGLSQNPAFFTGGVATPFSLLHLNGDNGGTLPQESGYRDWMRYGIVFTHNRDLMYVGPRRNVALDKTDAVIAWADNADSSSVGPDVLRFLFLGGGNGTTTVNNNNPFDSGDYDGIEIARMLGDGAMGIGTR